VPINVTTTATSMSRFSLPDAAWVLMRRAIASEHDAPLCMCFAVTPSDNTSYDVPNAMGIVNKERGRNKTGILNW